MPMIALPYTYGTCHKLLTFLCGLPSRHSGERRAVEWRLFSADRGPLEGCAWTSAQ